MYHEFYNLDESAFSLACEPKFFFASEAHTEALASMVYVVRQRKGMVLVTGQVGAGKTFVSHMLAAKLGPAVNTVVVKHPPKTAKNLMRTIAKGVGLSLPASADSHTLQQEVHEHLLRLCRRDRLVCLVMDESQDLTPAAMEELRLIWNWEFDGQRLVQIVLIGQPELRDLLLQPRWESLRQRIVLSFHLTGLGRDDIEQYIKHRLAKGGCGQAEVDFTEQAIERIAQASQGIPRLINTLCDNSLLVGYNRQTNTIDASIVEVVMNDMNCWGLNASIEANAELAPSIPGDQRG